MKTKAKGKKFDCVAMKRKVQESLMAEYEARRDEFPTYGEFIRSIAKQSSFWKKFRANSTRRKATRSVK